MTHLRIIHVSQQTGTRYQLETNRYWLILSNHNFRVLTVILYHAPLTPHVEYLLKLHRAQNYLSDLSPCNNPCRVTSVPHSH